VIANAGAMGLDWRTLSLSDYFEALEAFNEAHDPDPKSSSKDAGDLSDLRRLMKSHGG
jgi:hypothetical protein